MDDVPFKFFALEQLMYEKSTESGIPLLDPQQIAVLGDMVGLTKEERNRALELFESTINFKIFPHDGGFLSSCVIVRLQLFIDHALQLSRPQSIYLDQVTFKTN